MDTRIAFMLLVNYYHHNACPDPARVALKDDELLKKRDKLRYKR